MKMKLEFRGKGGICGGGRFHWAHIMLVSVYVCDWLRLVGRGRWEKWQQCHEVDPNVHSCERAFCFHIGASQTAQSDRRKLCWDNPSVETSKSHPFALSLMHTQTHFKQSEPAQTKWYEYLKTDWGKKKEVTRRKNTGKAIGQVSQIHCMHLSHVPVSWSLWVCVCLRVCLTSLLYLSRAHLLSITYFPFLPPFFSSLFSSSSSLPF